MFVLVAEGDLCTGWGNLPELSEGFARLGGFGSFLRIFENLNLYLSGFSLIVFNLVSSPVFESRRCRSQGGMCAFVWTILQRFCG